MSTIMIAQSSVEYDGQSPNIFQEEEEEEEKVEI